MPLPLDVVLAELEASAPLHLAEPWDNVGLLLEPTSPGEQSPEVARMLLTIDCTWPVLQEALRRDVQVVVAYHPVIFSGLKRLRHRVPSEKVVVEAIRRGMVVYSPHTALDAVAGGMTDWLAAALGPGDARAIVPSVGEAHQGESSRPQGQGRVVVLQEPVDLNEACQRIKGHLGLERVRLAAAARHGSGAPIRSWAVCPGAGGSVFEKVGAVDLLLTGEMRHHDVLTRIAQGTSVILCDHTNTERGFLPVYAERLRLQLPGVEILVSAEDRDPLSIL